MNTANSSWWVPLGAAAIALLGVIVGQLVGALAEGRRHHRDAQQRAFEHWRDKKFDAYGEFLRITDSAIDTTVEIAASWGDKIYASDEFAPINDEEVLIARYKYDRLEEKLKSVDGAIVELGANIATLRLVASESWYESAHETYKKFLEAYQLVTRRPGDTPLPTNEYKELGKSLMARTRRLLENARMEFGIHSDDK